MKFYSYSNNNYNYTKAISLENVRSIERENRGGTSKIRYSIVLNYIDGKTESLMWLEEEESKEVYKEIIELLNK